MSERSAIEWCDATWNPVTGCDRTSPGCANCYALALAPRLRAMGVPKYRDVRDGGPASGPAFGVTLHPGELDRPRRWRRARRIFVNSMSDLFHDEVPVAFIDRVFDTIAACPQHTFQLLTKRPRRMLAYCQQRHQRLAGKSVAPVPWPNVWLGVSVENRRFVHRVDVLRETPAAVRFVSAEPLLGPLLHDSWWTDPVTSRSSGWSDGYAGPELDLTAIDWLIVGGESGPGRRLMRAEWVRDLRELAVATGTALFFKQWGGPTPKAGGRLLDGRAWAQFPTAHEEERDV